MAVCEICEKRRPKRYCLALRAEICPLCCGEEREQTISCPLECEYLREAHAREKPNELDPEELPYREVEITEEFLAQNGPLVSEAGRLVAEAGLGMPGTADKDVLEALDAMIRTLKTLESGVIYETKPANPYAANVYERVRAGIEEFRKKWFEETGMHSFRDRDLMGALIFLRRLGDLYQNRRKRGRAFLAKLREAFGRAQHAGTPATRPTIIRP